MLNKIWLRLSIDKKVRSFALVVIVIILVSSGFSMFTMGFSLKDYSEILDENKICQEFMDAMESEGNAFHSYIAQRSDISSKDDEEDPKEDIDIVTIGEEG
ncbi:hypothetical protein UYO_2614, partial [Lachnospiraceae bacterium JC7]